MGMKQRKTWSKIQNTLFFPYKNLLYNNVEPGKRPHADHPKNVPVI